MKKVLNILVFLFLTGCGFKIVNQKGLGNYDISEINLSGDKKINYEIRNKVLFNSTKNAKALINVNIYTQRIKTVKEKNIKNEITKYQILIKSEVDIEDLKDNNFKFSMSKTGDFVVSSKYSQTLNNEKKLVQILTDAISKEIIEKIIIKINDL